MRAAIALLVVAACGKNDAPPAPAPAPIPTPSPAVNVIPSPFIVAEAAEIVADQPLRWERDGHLWEPTSDPRRPRDLGERTALTSAVFDDDYWYVSRCTSNCEIDHGQKHTLTRIGRHDGARRDLVESDPFDALYVDGEHLLWRYSPYGPRGEMRRMHRDGGAVEVLWKDASSISGFHVHPDGILAWTATSVAWIPDGQPAQPLAIGTFPRASAIDATHVYVAEHDRGGTRIVRIPRAGGASKVIAASRGVPHGIAVDDRHVYWVLQDQRGVLAASKSGGGHRVIELPPTPEDPCMRTLGMWPAAGGLYVVRSGITGCGSTLYFVPTK